MSQTYEYRAPGNADIAQLPNAHAHVGADGVVFVANGGDPAVATAALAFLEAAWNEAGERFALEETLTRGCWRMWRKRGSPLL